MKLIIYSDNYYCWINTLVSPLCTNYFKSAGGTTHDVRTVSEKQCQKGGNKTLDNCMSLETTRPVQMQTIKKM